MKKLYTREDLITEFAAMLDGCPFEVMPGASGKWELEISDIEGDAGSYQCSICGCDMPVPYMGTEQYPFDYCPMCGSRMEVGA